MVTTKKRIPPRKSSVEFHYSRLTDVEAVPYRLCGKQAYIVTLSHPNLRGWSKRLGYAGLAANHIIKTYSNYYVDII